MPTQINNDGSHNDDSEQEQRTTTNHEDKVSKKDAWISLCVIVCDPANNLQLSSQFLVRENSEETLNFGRAENAEKMENGGVEI